VAGPEDFLNPAYVEPDVGIYPFTKTICRPYCRIDEVYSKEPSDLIDPVDFFHPSVLKDRYTPNFEEPQVIDDKQTPTLDTFLNIPDSNPDNNQTDPLVCSDLTEMRLDGNGAFDCLMRAVNVHLGEQWEQGRIDGVEYAQTYLQAMSIAMQNAVNFLQIKFNSEVILERLPFEKEQIDKQTALLGYQAAQMAAQTRQIDQATKDEALNAVVQRNLQRTQRVLAEEQSDQVRTQRELSEKQHPFEIELLREQTRVQYANAMQLQKQIEKIHEESINLGVQREEMKENGKMDRTLKRAQKQVQEQQAGLYERQSRGFDDKVRMDALKIVMDSWAVQNTEIDDNNRPLDDLTPVALKNKILRVLREVGL